jgi:alpha-galactosidase
MAVRAAVEGDVTLLKQAMMHDPLTAAVCNTEEIWQMTDEMLVAQSRWLPQYTDEIPAARKRLARHKRNGTYLGTKKWKGAARLHTKTVSEMKKHANPRRR